MERNGDRNVDELIDLGSVVAETKGGQVSGDDSILQRQQTGIGLEDD
ncbi:benenodin family lasso peptide [Sphingobium ummariense]